MVGAATTVIARPDVGAALPEVPESGHAGFAYAFRPGDFTTSGAAQAAVALRFVGAGRVKQLEPMSVPILRSTADVATLPRSPFPASITTLLLRASPRLDQADFRDREVGFEAVDLLSWLAERGPRPLDGLYTYLGYLRSVDSHARFVERYFPRLNRRAGSDRDVACVLTSRSELLAIAHHLFVLADAGAPGGLLEFGCYKGYSTSLLSFACRQIGRPMEVFDSFAGLPAVGSTFYRAGDFTGTLEEVKGHVSAFGAIDAVAFHEGFFSESVPRWNRKPVACIWMDVDLERSADDALRIFDALDVRGALFSHECLPQDFDAGRVVPRRGVDQVIGPILDAFAGSGRRPAGAFVAGQTGAFWDEASGIPVLGSDALERLLALARA
jgi:hypothetical protein